MVNGLGDGGGNLTGREDDMGEGDGQAEGQPDCENVRLLGSGYAILPFPGSDV